MSASQITWDAPQGAAPDAASAPPQIKWDEEQEPGFLDKDIPLAGHWYNPTLSGVQSIGRGVRSAVEGIGHTIAHPIDTAEDTANAIANVPSTIKAIPGAIHDINASPDPLEHYAKAAQDTAGEGAGQALVALGTEGLAKGAPAAARVAKPALRAGLRAASDVVDPDLLGMASPRLAHAERWAGRMADKLTPKPVYPGAHLPENPGQLTLNPVYPGAHLPETPAPEQLNPSLASEARTLPGQIGKEVIRPTIERPAPIPARRGLALPAAEPAADPILEKLRGYAAKIAKEGHGDELPEPDEATPHTTNLNEDLTPALKASLRAVRAAKAARIAKPAIQ